ncbi:MAG: hypothetical protein Q9187_005935 [Circinaria calcarea]
MAIKGQRFHVDLESGDDSEYCDGALETARPSTGASPAFNLAFVQDITERSTSARPPSPPKLKNSVTGFPAHKTRSTSSAFKRQRKGDSLEANQHHGPRSQEMSQAQSRGDSSISLDTQGNESLNETDRRSIDEENQQRIARMSTREIEQEKAELLAGLSPSLIERLLKKANINDEMTDNGMNFRVDPKAREPLDTGPSAVPSRTVSKKVMFETLNDDTPSGTILLKADTPMDPDARPLVPPSDLYPASSQLPLPLPPNIHFPRPPSPPSIDPADPNFLDNLHSKYFPDLPVDPSKLAWMAPIPSENSPADQDSPYNPLQQYLPPTSIRFDFRGRLLPPRLARQIPSTKGLHHHGLAPEAAGYTIPELAHLSRSAVAAQRSIAYQTLGRILYRLGRGDFGNEDDELYLGLWKCVEEGRVLDTLISEAGREDGQGNRTCKVTATEAVWLWRRGGGKRWKAH